MNLLGYLSIVLFFSMTISAGMASEVLVSCDLKLRKGYTDSKDQLSVRFPVDLDKLNQSETLDYQEKVLPQWQLNVTPGAMQASGLLFGKEVRPFPYETNSMTVNPAYSGEGSAEKEMAATLSISIPLVLPTKPTRPYLDGQLSLFLCDGHGPAVLENYTKSPVVAAGDAYFDFDFSSRGGIGFPDGPNIISGKCDLESINAIKKALGFSEDPTCVKGVYPDSYKNLLIKITKMVNNGKSDPFPMIFDSEFRRSHADNPNELLQLRRAAEILFGLVSKEESKSELNPLLTRFSILNLSNKFDSSLLWENGYASKYLWIDIHASEATLLHSILTIGKKYQDLIDHETRVNKLHEWISNASFSNCSVEQYLREAQYRISQKLGFWNVKNINFSIYTQNTESRSTPLSDGTIKLEYFDKARGLSLSAFQNTSEQLSRLIVQSGSKTIDCKK